MSDYPEVPEQNYRIGVNDPVFLGGAARESAELDLSPDRPDYVTPDGVEVWIERKRQKTRFLDAHGGQVGPVHLNLAPAIVWARMHGWRDPSLPQWFNDGAIAEVSAGGASFPEGWPVSLSSELRLVCASCFKPVSLTQDDEYDHDTLDDGLACAAWPVRVVRAEAAE